LLASARARVLPLMALGAAGPALFLTVPGTQNRVRAAGGQTGLLRPCRGIKRADAAHIALC